MEVKKHVSRHHASQLLHNKFVVVLGDSIQRAVYKDIVLLLQKEKYLTAKQLKNKGEMSFEQDSIVEGGRLKEMHNGTEYREVRQFRSDHHLVRFYFVTRIYSCYMRSVLEDFRSGLKPDVVVVNSCVWDISRYSCRWINDYKDHLQKFFSELKEILPEQTLIVWNLTMPVGERIRGGFLVPQIEHKAPLLRDDVIEANFYSATLANSYGMDVLDLHYHFRFSLQHRTNDGVHWNALAHRWITSLLIKHIAEAWGVSLPLEETKPVPDTPRSEGGGNKRKRRKYPSQNRYRGPALSQPSFSRQHGSNFSYWPPFHIDPYMEHQHHDRQSRVFRPRHIRPHHIRPHQTPYPPYQTPYTP
eukprot:XP_011604904.1 PREDICTED: PC-esterase domain-containing protein 1A-like isoform X1 [Takifugu rubripes]